MASIDRGSRLTYAQLKAHFDGIALAKQQLATKVGDDFTSFITTGYTDNTLARDIDISIDGTTTGLLGLTSVSGIAAIAPVLDSMRRKLTSETHALTTKLMVEAGYGDYIKALMTAFCTGYDTTYDNFWDAFAALFTAGQYVPGEVVDIMNAVGIKVDPAYCYPPAHKLLAILDFSGDAAATITTYDEIDPLLYQTHVSSADVAASSLVEAYVVARDGTPTEITISCSKARDEDDTPTDTGATTFTVTIAAAGGTGGTVADTVGLLQASSHALCSTRDATSTSNGWTLTGGEAADTIAIRVKTLRSMAFPT